MTDRLIAYARRYRLTRRAAVDRLVTIALDHLERSAAGGWLSASRMSPDARAARARAAANARWQKTD